jgi:hypothetical protein
MKRSIMRVCRVAMLVTLVCGASALASAAPLSSSRFDVNYTGSGQMTVDVYGQYYSDVASGQSTSAFAAGDGWNPMAFGEASGYGQYDGMTVFGRDTADPTDDFVRYWFSASNGGNNFRWTVPQAEQEPTQPSAVPEPGTMILLGSGLLAVASAVRRGTRARS